ncbi:Calcium/calmodulin dependent protein kinase II Association [Novipirellula artificiosorum]|uniref:Calcium/calmodulin dependent protein kinase II Association n=2 Tax=Novipirellula artificiosorum TaxID=2528016 RepID=A0A5C6DIP2_9BACT|nr:Calcium/calmodulin dependent protein kinase II Association [Novipirellula artificiosorum]
MIGVDPESKQVTWWFFNQDGSLGKNTCKLKEEGVWSFEQPSEDAIGDNSYRGLVTRMDENTIKEEVLELILNGEEQENGTFIWKRASSTGQDFAGEQKEVWDTLETQVALDLKKDLDAENEYLHPKASYWGDQSPAPVSASAKTYSYYEKWLEGQDEVVAHQMIPVTVVVVDDVAIINFYLHILTKDDEGEQEEMIIRGHNTWKKENGRWLLLSTYNTVVKSDDDD